MDSCLRVLGGLCDSPQAGTLYLVWEIYGEKLSSVVCVSNVCSYNTQQEFLSCLLNVTIFLSQELAFRRHRYEKADRKALSKDFGLAFNGGIIAERASTLSLLGFLIFKFLLRQSERLADP